MSIADCVDLMKIKVTCPRCRKLEQYGRMVWFDGKQFCPACHERIVKEGSETKKCVNSQKKI
jgi:hypothetical protein